MEYCMVARALKPSLRRELASKSTQQAFFEDFLCSNSNNGVVSCEDFSVDCFFDFSNGEFKDSYIQELEEEEEGDEEEKDFVSVSSQERVDDDNNSNFSNFSDSFLTSQPVEELAELEWVSQIVDDSSSEFPLLYPLETDNQNHVMNRFQKPQPQPEPVYSKPSCLFPSKIPAKARSKRSRLTSHTWSGSCIIDSSSTLSSSSSTTSSVASTPFVLTSSVPTIDSFPTEPLIKKPKKKAVVQTIGLTNSTQFQRRCSHCHVQKTPQWRTGPLGAKTLCNACGVRYKSGRLFPEYRPACSPTFSEEVHSNSHRKVLEIRKRKEMTGQDSGLNQMVHSF
ncbi:hypothetical protein JCGZ_26740 [Jatropha curcas]|uniref:GATA transcription factor n=1 Tax=Jatropha curcas TaxID=180498 RepID=A0A067L003_JATCU|nr:hypothetical protein JCGZ_26740 [Jatropha curcas]